MELDDIFGILKDVPDYRVFLTVDELKTSSQELLNRYPDTVEILPIGCSRQNDPIEAIKIGDGPKKALLYAMPHPNEPIGSMMLEYLSFRLAEDDGLREALGYTWYLVKCIDPDGTRLNEGWFKGPFSIRNYASHFYRPSDIQQIEWTFPIDYKTLHFHDPLPETQALMALIEQMQPDFICPLHNCGFGGAYFYISEEATPLYDPFYKLVDSQDLPLHQGEPEAPFITKYADAIFEDSPIADAYDYLEEQTGTDPAEVIKWGANSTDYAMRIGNPFCLVCEVPYFYSPAIQDTSPSDMLRRDAVLQGVGQAEDDIGFLKGQYDVVKSELTVSSPFRDAIEEYLRIIPQMLVGQKNQAQTDPEFAERATVAQKFSNLVIGKFYRLLLLGMFIRMLDAQINVSGDLPSLSSAQEAANVTFEAHITDFMTDLDYTVIPIQKLVRVQLGSALLGAEYAVGRLL
jgi:hypothetical protein